MLSLPYYPPSEIGGERGFSLRFSWHHSTNIQIYRSAGWQLTVDIRYNIRICTFTIMYNVICHTQRNTRCAIRKRSNAIAKDCTVDSTCVWTCVDACVRTCNTIICACSNSIPRMSAEPGRKAPCSIDLCHRMIWQTVGMGWTFRKVAHNFNVALGTVHNVFRRFELCDRRGRSNKTW